MSLYNAFKSTDEDVTQMKNDEWICPECQGAKDGHKLATVGALKILLCPNTPLGEVFVFFKVDSPGETAQ